MLLLQISSYHINLECYCILTVCSQPITIFIVILIYNDDSYWMRLIIYWYWSHGLERKSIINNCILLAVVFSIKLSGFANFQEHVIQILLVYELDCHKCIPVFSLKVRTSFTIEAFWSLLCIITQNCLVRPV